jgi:hypothetical protein
MAYKIQLEKRALIEIDDALEYYSKISNKVLKNFDNELQKAYKTIAKNPFFQKRYKNFRVLPLKKHPFIIVFTIDEESEMIKIFAVFNTSQNPDKLP